MFHRAQCWGLCCLAYVHLNDLDIKADGSVSKFADDTTTGGVANSEEDCQKIQQDLGQIKRWAEKWQIKLNLSKCEVLHFGRVDAKRKYR